MRICFAFLVWCLMPAPSLGADLRYAADPVAWAVERVGFTPDAWQAEALRSREDRELWNVTRQGGKSTTAALKTGHEAIYGPPGYTALLSGPSERQSTELMRKVRAAITAGVEPAEIVREGETYIELTRDRRVLAVPAKEKTVRGVSAVHRLLLDEAARVPDDLYRAVRPMLAVSGGRLTALSTPFGQRGWFYQEWRHGGPRWTRREIPWTACPRITPAFIEEERASATSQGLDPDLWIAQEYACSFAAAIQGAYYAKLLEDARRAGRIREVPYDPRFPVLTAWDLGVGDATAVWFVQQVGVALHVIGYHEKTGEGLPYYAGFLAQHECRGNYEAHLWPHDGDHRSPESGLPLKQAGETAGIKPIRIIPRTSDLLLDIAKVRALIPRCYFDEANCAQGLDALGFYHSERDEARQTFKPTPEHDWSSNGADALRTLAVGLRPKDRGADRFGPVAAGMDFDPMTYEHARQAVPHRHRVEGVPEDW